MVSRAIFEVRIASRDYDRSCVVEWRSYRFNLSQSVMVRRERGDPKPLARFMEDLVGKMLQSFAGLRLRDSEVMVRDLMPHFEREIYAYMEQMEYAGRRDDYMDSLRNNASYSCPGEYIATFHSGGSQSSIHANDYFAYPFAPEENKEAVEKARKLLLQNLDATQQKSLNKDNSFQVTGKDGKVYQIKRARSFNVVGPDGAKYCGQLVDTPIEDQMLAQKLLLEHDPDKFFKNANVSGHDNALAGIMRPSAVYFA
mgnify:FL=1